MKTTLKISTLALIAVLMSCGGGEEKKKTGFSYETNSTTETNTSAEAKDIPASKTIDLTNKGIGPITSLNLDTNIDANLAKQGEELFTKTCTACHRPDKKFIGPAPKDILNRRTPEWVMNLILNPNNMVKDDPLAKALLEEHNGSPMPVQITSEDEARALLEYFRTL
ncbi:cytochrome c [Tamlana sp. 2_MG-2023]|uniref:c-type cytochrome n=1 Tax=unclassified Tamlana TaxID=2614803 RepID=UPI0026E11E55|nr:MULTISPECIES: cytochrome c [unclassified Tamlana]MDO6759886.1 cytochrome c [Tamlana sp. 2_MG-2023]MDO6791944.1 cytochrome c [Tamlana sp. 1_MG-2023]